MSDIIIRVAARGDGVTANGRHAAFAAPGDTLSEDAASRLARITRHRHAAIFRAVAGASSSIWTMKAMPDS